jgi:hypothetical protein
MSDALQNLAFDIQAPRVGQIAVQAVTTSASGIDLAAPGASAAATGVGPVIALNAQQIGAYNMASLPSSDPSSTAPTVQALVNPPGFIGHYVEFFADGADMGVIFGPTQASVSSANVPALATTGAAGTPGTCVRIPAGTFRVFLIKGDDRWLGVVGAASGQLRISIASR